MPSSQVDVASKFQNDILVLLSRYIPKRRYINESNKDFCEDPLYGDAANTLVDDIFQSVSLPTSNPLSL